MIHKAFVVLVLATVLAVGCSSDGSTNAERDDDENTLSSSAVTGPDGSVVGGGQDDDVGEDSSKGGPSAEEARNSESGFNEEISSSSEIDERRAIPIERVESDGKTVTIFFEMESQKCFGVDAEVEETETQVKLSLSSGLLADAKASSCGVGVFPYQTKVTLDDPVGDRALIAGDDGASPTVAEPSTASADKDVLEIEVDAAGEPDPEQFVGLDIEEAIDLAEGNDIKWRVTKIDGETRDDESVVADRLSFEIQDNNVVAAAVS